MAQNEIIRIRFTMRLFFKLLLLILPVSVFAQDYSWKAVSMDGSRRTAIEKGTLKLKKNSAAARTLKVVQAAQPAMARVKVVIGHSEEALSKAYPESGLSNWNVDVLMQKVGELSGKKIDIGFSNYGGIRVDMPKGDILLDDILSMFPFKNNLVYLEHKGSTIRSLLEWMASKRFEPFGGMKVEVTDGKIVSILVGGEPLQDDKIYTVAANSFILYGGDGLYLAKDAVSMVVYDELVQDAMLESIRKTEAEGKSFVYKCDSRIVVK